MAVGCETNHGPVLDLQRHALLHLDFGGNPSPNVKKTTTHQVVGFVHYTELAKTSSILTVEQTHEMHTHLCETGFKATNAHHWEKGQVMPHDSVCIFNHNLHYL